METIQRGKPLHLGTLQVASLTGSGINGNKMDANEKNKELEVASLTGSGINGNY